MKKLTIRTKLTILNVALLIFMCIVLTISINSTAKDMIYIIKASPVLPSEKVDSTTPDYSVNGSDTPESSMPSQTYQYAIAIENFVDTMYINLAIIVIVGGIATYFIIKHQVQPLEKLTNQIQNLTTSNLSSEIIVKSSSSEIVKLTKAFNEMTSNLQQSFEKQKRFSQMSAHEFRTPLAVMKTKLQVFKMKKEHSEKDYQTLVDTFSANTERLTNVIDCLLTLTNDDKTPLNDTVNLNEIVNSIERDLQPSILEKSIVLTKNIADIEFLGNKTLISRAIFNLVENAIRYSDENGKIELVATKDGEKCSFVVKDCGIGIPDDAKQKIFEPFFTVDKSRSRIYGGAGLGLSLVKEIVQKHGGKISVTDNLPCGSVFSMTIPLA
ncbi:MAG: HAMP domain-containing sensor histidine kinase [Clostridia bacterium]